MALTVTVFRYLLGFVLLPASVAKFRDLGRFERSVAGYDLLPGQLVRPVARLLPPLELGCAIALLAGVRPFLVGSVVAVLLAGFACAVAANLLRGRHNGCGCSGRGTEDPISWSIVLRNVVLAALATVIVAHPDRSLSSNDDVAALITAAVGLVGIALVRQTLSVRRRLNHVPRSVR